MRAGQQKEYSISEEHGICTETCWDLMLLNTAYVHSIAGIVMNKGMLFINKYLSNPTWLQLQALA